MLLRNSCRNCPVDSAVEMYLLQCVIWQMQLVILRDFYHVHCVSINLLVYT